MLIKNISGIETFFGWIPPYGKLLINNGETVISDSVALTEEFKTSYNNGKITVLSYSEDDFDQVIQKELSLQTIQGAQIANGTLTSDKFSNECLTTFLTPHYIYGYCLEWSDNNRVKIKPGYAKEDGGREQYIQSESDIIVDKRISGPGGLDTGMQPLNAWFYVWIARDPVLNDVIAVFSLSKTSPTLPAEYIYKRRIGVVRSKWGIIYNFIQTGSNSCRKYIYIKDALTNLSILSNGSSPTYTYIKAGTLCPPTTATAFLQIWAVPPSPVPTSSFIHIRPRGTSISVFRFAFHNTIVIVEVPLDTERMFDYKSIGGAKAYISVTGFTEDI